MRAVAEVTEQTRTRIGAIGALRLGRFVIALVVGVVLLLAPHLLWRAAQPNRPSPLARLYLRILSAAAGIRVRRRGIVLGGHALVASNHISWTDILALGGAARLTFVAKAEVRGWPGLGLLARLAPTVFVRRGARGEARQQSEAIAAALRHGPVVLFPEGTTGDGNGVLPFRTTLFAASGLVQPVAIAYDPPPGAVWNREQRAAFAWDGDKRFLPHVAAVIAAGGARCTIDVLPPIRGADRKALATAARDAIVAALAR
jgi:1-acyl-sn-glycerol-3-phosphate acyltransferase